MNRRHSSPGAQGSQSQRDASHYDLEAQKRFALILSPLKLESAALIPAQDTVGATLGVAGAGISAKAPTLRRLEVDLRSLGVAVRVLAPERTVLEGDPGGPVVGVRYLAPDPRDPSVDLRVLAPDLRHPDVDGRVLAPHPRASDGESIASMSKIKGLVAAALFRAL